MQIYVPHHLHDNLIATVGGVLQRPVRGDGRAAVRRPADVDRAAAVPQEGPHSPVPVRAIARQGDPRRAERIPALRRPGTSSLAPVLSAMIMNVV